MKIKPTIQNNTFDFAFSFAGEDRKVVERIKDELVSKNYSVFYDNDFNYDLVGKDLYAYLRTIYKNRCRYVVCFISENYTNKIWTNLEMTAIKERLMSTFFASDFLIPILLKKASMIQDIPSFIGFYEHKNVHDTSELLIKKINSALVEDNYLYNIDNCIKYIIESVCSFLISKKLQIDKSDKTIKIINQNREYVFRIESEQDFNLPCLLIYFGDSNNPDLFISWERIPFLSFEVFYFYKLKASEDNISIKSLIDIVSNYMINRMGK